MPFTINPDRCSIEPPTPQHFPADGVVIFNVTADCILDFSDPTVLGLPSFQQAFSTGNYQFSIAVPSGHTTFTITGCDAQKSGPGDIIVP